MSKIEQRFSRLEAYRNLISVLEELKKDAPDKGILNLFPGYGGLKELLLPVDELSAWNENDKRVHTEVTKVHGLLKDVFQKDYSRALESIKSSVLTSFYTPTDLIESVLAPVLDRLKGNRILEPSAGSGLFLEALHDSGSYDITAIEKDLLTARVLKALYPGDSIISGGFEEAKAKANYDLVISNIPFGAFGVYDADIFREAVAAKVKSTTRIHNYFAVKGIDHLRDNGLMVYLTSNALMDSPGNEEIRKYLMTKANFIGAVRLPNTVFQSVGTYPVTDVIVLEKDLKKGNNLSHNDLLFVASTKQKLGDVEVPINSYFKENEDRVLGKLVAGGQYSNDSLDVEPIEGKDILSEVREALKESLESIDHSIRVVQLPVESKLPDNVKLVPEKYPNRLGLREGNLIVLGTDVGEMKIVNDKVCFSLLPTIRDYQRVSALIEIRNISNQLIEAELNNEGERMDRLRKELNASYDQFSFMYGALNSRENIRFINADVEGFKLASLEKLTADSKFIKADIFIQRVNNVEREAKATSVRDAVLLSLNTHNKINIAFMAEMLKKEKRDVGTEGIRGGDFFLQFSSSGKSSFVTPDEFLSGNIVEKLESFAKVDRRKYDFMREEDWADHVQRLENVRPPLLPRHLIDVNMGVNWVPMEIYSAFAKHVFEVDVELKYMESVNDYMLELKDYSEVSYVKLAAKTNNNLISGKYIFEYAMNDSIPKLSIKVSSDPDVYVPDVTGMKNVEAKVRIIKQMWEDYSTNNKVVSKALVDIYNHDVNNTVPRKYDGSLLTFPGLKEFDPKWNQVDAVWKNLQDDGGLNDQVVGAGKTGIIVLSAMKKRQLGLARKPLILCLKANVGAIADDFKSMYPEAKVLAPSENDFSKKNRQKIFQQISTNDWDAVILTHDNFQRIPQDPEIVRRLDQDELDCIERDLKLVSENASLSKRILKGLQKRKQNLEVKMKIREETMVKDDLVMNFKTMGFDDMYVDESHQFKNLPFTTRQSQVSGLGTPEGSNRARNMLQAVRTIQEAKGGDRGVTFLSGTPISNSLVEMYLLKKYLMPTKLEAHRLNSFDAWAKMFAKKSSTFEFTVTGEVKQKTRYREFINLPELSMLYKSFAHTVVSAQLKDERPTLNHVMVNMDPTPAQESFIKKLIEFTKTKDGKHIGMPLMSETEKQAYMLLATNLARKMSIDMRLIDETLPAEEKGKINTLCSMVAREYRESNSFKGTQLIFSDIGTPGTKGFNVYEEIKRVLVNNFGIPANEIVFAHDYNTKAKGKTFTTKMNSGEYRIAIGSTATLGTGRNVQKRVIGLHKLDVPWTPKDDEQRNGRAERKGAEMARLHRDNKVNSYFYAVNRTLDAYQYNILSNKQKFIEQVKTNAVVRKIDEGSIDQENGMSYSEYVALLSGNQDLLKKAQLEKKIANIEQDYKAFQSQQVDNIGRKEREEKSVKVSRETLERLKNDFSKMKLIDMENVPMEIGGKLFIDKKEAGEALLKLSKSFGEKGLKEKVARQGIFDLYFDKRVTSFENGAVLLENKLQVVSDHGTVFNYASGILNENPALAGRYIIDATKRIGSVIEETEKKISASESLLQALAEEGGKKFDGINQLEGLKKELEEVEARITASNNKEEAQAQKGEVKQGRKMKAS